MARRRGSSRSYENGHRASIGDYYVDIACNHINQACAKEAAMFAGSLSVHEVISMLFRDEHVAKLKAVHGLLALEDVTHSYRLAPYLNCVCHFNTRGLMPTPANDAMYWQPERADALVRAVQTLNELHVKWGAVKHLLRWFNRNATIGAVRANWPSVMTLCPDAPSLKELQHSPTRYTNPQELSALLPLIRATSTTVASMTMLPGDAQPRIKGTVWIELPARTVDYEGTSIKLDHQIFNL